jgi:hypothetical protein
MLSVSARANIIEVLQEKHEKGKLLELEETIQLLSGTLQLFSKIYLGIDALDECMDEHRKQLLCSFADLLGDPNTSQLIRLFFTGRPHVKESVPSKIQRHLGIPVSVTLKADAHDIRTYVLHQLDLDDYKDNCMNEELRKEILQKIIDTSDGMLVSSSPN